MRLYQKVLALGLASFLSFSSPVFAQEKNPSKPIIGTTIEAKSLEGMVSQDKQDSMKKLINEIKEGEIKYVIVGEAHTNVPIKNFTGDLVEALLDEGFEVGLYLEALYSFCGSENFRECIGTSSVMDWNSKAYTNLILRLKGKVSIYGINVQGKGDSERVDAWVPIIQNGKGEIKVILTGAGHVNYPTEEPQNVDLPARLKYEQDLTTTDFALDNIPRFKSGSNLVVAYYSLDDIYGYSIKSLDDVDEMLKEKGGLAKVFKDNKIGDFVVFTRSSPLELKSMWIGRIRFIAPQIPLIY